MAGAAGVVALPLEAVLGACTVTSLEMTALALVSMMPAPEVIEHGHHAVNRAEIIPHILYLFSSQGIRYRFGSASRQFRHAAGSLALYIMRTFADSCEVEREGGNEFDLGGFKFLFEIPVRKVRTVPAWPKSGPV